MVLGVRFEHRQCWPCIVQAVSILLCGQHRLAVAIELVLLLSGDLGEVSGSQDRSYKGERSADQALVRVRLGQSVT